MDDIETIGDLDNADNKKRLIRAIELLMDHLLLHSWGEDTFYYPEVDKAVEKGLTKIDRPYMIRMEKEHEVIDSELQQVEILIKQSPLSGEWRQRYANFKKNLIHHMNQEEEELFPLSEMMLGKKGLEEISATLEKNRKNAPAIRLHQRL